MSDFSADAVAASQPMCCAKHSYCCVVKAACRGDRAATEVVAESQANNVAQPTCCGKHAYCCVVKAACCSGRESAEATLTEVAVSVAQATCCAKHAYCCVVKSACCGKSSEQAVEESIDSIGKSLRDQLNEIQPSGQKCSLGCLFMESCSMSQPTLPSVDWPEPACERPCSLSILPKRL